MAFFNLKLSRISVATIFRWNGSLNYYTYMYMYNAASGILRWKNVVYRLAFAKFNDETSNVLFFDSRCTITLVLRQAVDILRQEGSTSLITVLFVSAPSCLDKTYKNRNIDVCLSVCACVETHSQMLPCIMAVKGHEPSCNLDSSGSPPQPGSPEACRYEINQ